MCRELVADRNTEARNIQAMIMGIPNVGKSTLINLLSGRKIAKTGDEAGVTKAQQRIRLGERIVHGQDRKSTRLNSSHVATSYAVFCLKKKKLRTIIAFW